MNAASSFASAVAALKVGELPLSKYSRNALRRVVASAEYYVEIYHNCLEHVLEMCQKGPDEVTVVDYGGGHGLLSILAKQIGFGRVLYVDSNPDALQTVRMLSERMGYSPDVMIEGDAGALRRWCEAGGVEPDAVVGVDVIEHIYVLDDFFSSLHAVAPQAKMVFTTASTPFNKRVRRRLRKAMVKDEKGNALKKGFWQMRRDCVKEMHPDMPERELDYWADNTRGLTFDDVRRAVEARVPSLLLDPYNTCDPRTGSWTERILPVEDYEQILMPYGLSLRVLPGRYNVHRRGLKAAVGRHYNKTVDKSPRREPSGLRERRRYRKALKVAPFIYMLVS